MVANRRGMKGWCILSAVLFAAILPSPGYAVIVKITNDCWTNPLLKNDTDFTLFFNDCRRDLSDAGILRYISEQLFLWANADSYLLYITILLAFIPAIAWWNNPDPDLSTRAAQFRFQLLLLLFRVALGYNISIWLIAAFNLEKPCVCKATNEKDSIVDVTVGIIEGTGPWGMPSLECITGTIVAIFFFENIAPVLGLLMLFLVPMSQLCLGYNSLGQVIAGVFIAIMIHVYQTRSALFLRPLDTFFSFILGYTLLSVSKDKHPDISYSWARVFLSTFVWQIFFYSLVLSYYDSEFIMSSSRKSIATMQDSDFSGFLSSESAPFNLSPQKPLENTLTGICICVLYFLLMVIRISADNFDSWL